MKKIRLTGGEPLVRRDLDRLVGDAGASSDADLTLTTNGSLLAKQAPALKEAGLDRITVSLDSLDDATFRAMNDADFPVAKVLEGIDAAAAAGLGPVKINMVVKRGVNDQQHRRDGASTGASTGHILRFIEYMDVGSTNGWRMDDVIPSAEVVRRIGERWPLEPVDAELRRRSRRALALRDGAGEIGVISSVTQAFCCELQPHAPVDRGLALHLPVRAVRPRPEERCCAAARPTTRCATRSPRSGSGARDRYSEIRTAETAKERKVEMSYIGG